MVEVEEQLICDVLAVTVRLARFVSVVPKLIAVLPDKETVPEPKLMVQEFPLLETSCCNVKLYVDKLNEPFVSVNVPPPAALRSIALPSVQEQSTPLTMILEANAAPFVVNVSPVELLDSVIVPVYVRVNPVAGSVTLP